MIKDLLTEAGFVEGETFKEVRFLRPPDQTFAVWTDARSARGSDLDIMIVNHALRVEIYSYTADEKKSAAFEAALNRRGIEWDCDERIWLPDEQMFLLTYSFSHEEKL